MWLFIVLTTARQQSAEAGECGNFTSVRQSGMGCKHQSNVITSGPDPGLKVGFVIFAVVTMTGTVTGRDVRPAGVPGSGEQKVCQTSGHISAADRPRS